MKRIAAIIAVLTLGLVLSAGMGAQETHLRLMGGFTTSSAKMEDIKTGSINDFHVGLGVQVPLGAGFAIQPAVTYQTKGMDFSEIGESGMGSFFGSLAKNKVGFLEIPVQVQWGPDLLLFRPYVFGEPFVGYRVGVQEGISGTLKDNLKSLEYGVGLGAGVEVWIFQLSAKWFWNFGGLFKETAAANLPDSNFHGFAATLAIRF